jgi:hypothetical protein
MTDEEIANEVEKRLRERILRLAKGDAELAAEMLEEFYVEQIFRLMETAGDEAAVEALNRYWRKQDIQLEVEAGETPTWPRPTIN